MWGEPGDVASSGILLYSTMLCVGKSLGTWLALVFNHALCEESLGTWLALALPASVSDIEWMHYDCS